MWQIKMEDKDEISKDEISKDDLEADFFKNLKSFLSSEDDSFKKWQKKFGKIIKEGK